MIKNIIKLFTVACCGLLLFAAQASALPWVSGSNIVIDLSAEYLLNKVTDTSLTEAPENSLYWDSTTKTYYTTDNLDATGSLDTTLEVGDRLRTIFRVHEIQNDSGANFLSDTSMFAGVSEIEVLSVTPTAGGLANFVFGVSSDFSDTYETLGGTAGAIVAMHYLNDSNPFAWENGGADALGVADEEALVSNVTSAPLYWTFGFTGTDGIAADGEGWETLGAPTDIALFSALTTTQQAGSLYFGLSLLDNLLGPDLNESVEQNPVPGIVPLFGDGSDNYLYGSAGLFGIQRDNGSIFTPFDATNSLRAEVNVDVIPEPTTFLLFGVGLLGFAGISRKRMK